MELFFLLQWFKGGYTNICYNALDKHVNEGRGDNVAILWEGNDVGHEMRLTYRDVLKKTCQVRGQMYFSGLLYDSTLVYVSVISHEQV